MMNFRYGIVILALGASAYANAHENGQKDSGQKYTVENHVKVYRGGLSQTAKAAQAQRLQAIVKTNVARETLAVRRFEAQAKASANKQAAFERGFVQGRKAQRNVRSQRPYRNFYSTRYGYSGFRSHGSFGHFNRRGVSGTRTHLRLR